MSRVAKSPIVIPISVEVKLNHKIIFIKGKKGELIHTIHTFVDVQQVDNRLFLAPHGSHVNGWAIAGTTRALLNNMIIGVTRGFTKKLHLVGVGYRADVKYNVVHLSLGFSHSIEYKLPKGIIAECPSQVEILLKGIDKQMIGQVAADLRAYRSPDPYEGKGIRYADEIVRTKEAKKK